ncbi:benzoate/H(+) symporter BenE family transporter [Legionella impletisoli]|uniref:Benzoate transporter n=1 Tax=Legionella impletisoli TaxID=343510 RepID=A0A917JW63_9GAMM|nr:benzoate/H(+) symporter BenE family transporter [Legionella impletisoli]GGI89263.1 benzoate transporter [Legionella impletisoli]
MRNYFSLNQMTAGFVGMMVGFTSSIALIFQAARTAGANEAEISSWLLALGLSIAITCIGLSLRYRAPILIGWSTPGAALLIGSLSGTTLSEAIGAFIFCAGLTILAGVTGIFERIMAHIPRSLASAMLAGILISFGMNIFSAMQEQFLVVFSMFLTYLIGKRFIPRFAILAVLLIGVLIAKLTGILHLSNVHLMVSKPIFTVPVFTFSALISIGLPLFIVTMTSQNLPGTAILKANGYEPPISPIISWVGLTTLIFAPFGCFSINLAAITAAICASNQADPDPAKRYKATVFAGLCWIVFGLFGATIVALVASFPQQVIIALAGLALLSTIGNNLKTALDDEAHRESSLITILVSGSGISFLGIGSAFWGLAAGILALFMFNWDGLKLKLSHKSAIKTSL